MRSPFVTFLHWNVFTVIANRFQLLQIAISSYKLNGSSKLYWSWTAKDNWTTHVFRRTNCLTTRPVDTYFSFKHFSVRYRISWECSDPNSSPQGVFTSSGVQTPALLPCSNWSLCWSNYRTYWMSVVNEHWNICPHLIVASFVTSYILCGVSVATLTELSVDSLLSLSLGLRYRQVVTLKRTYLIVITSWATSAVFSAMWFWNPPITTWYRAP